MKKHLSILVLLLCGITSIIANPLVLTENSALDLALIQNYDLRSSLIDLEKTEDQNNNSWNIMLPDLSFEGSLTNSNNIFCNTIDDDLSISGSFKSSITLNKSDRYYMQYDKLAYEAQSLLYVADEEALKVEVKKAFYYLIAYKQKISIKKNNLDLAFKRFEQMQSNYNNGFSSELEVLKTQSTYENLKPSYTSSNTEYKTQLMAFKSLLGINFNQEIELDGNLDVEILNIKDDTLIATFLENRLDIASAEKSIEVKKSLLKIKKATERSPSVSLSLDYTINNSDVLSLDWNDKLSVKTTLSIPLNGFIKGSSEDVAINDAQRSVEQSQLNYQSVIENAEREIKTLVLEIEGYQENIEISESAIKISQKTYDANEEAYNLGTIDLLSLEDAQSTLFSAKQDLLTSQYNYLSAILDLEQALNASSDDIKAVTNL